MGDQTDIIKESMEFEKKIGKLLKKKEISFKTQEDLTIEQKKEFGKAVITPDFLLDEEVIINNKLIKWIEVKNFYGSQVKHFKKSIKKQISKYYEKWGTGCIVFRNGFNEDLNFLNNLII